MKIICSKNNLLKSVSISLKAVPSKTTMPILECILIDASASQIKFTTNDMELGIETIVDGQIEEKGMVALFVSAAVVRVMLIIVMQKGSLSAHGARRMFPPTICPLRPRSFGCKLMMAVSAEILLVTI